MDAGSVRPHSDERGDARLDTVSDTDEADDPVLPSVAAYSAHAAEYEAQHAAKRAPEAERFARSLPVPSRILDAGCGPGRDLARFVAHGHDARGVDLNPVFVAMANRYAPTIECDLRDLAAHFAPDQFDGIWATASLVHVREADTRTVLAQFAALLRAGGRLHVSLRCTGETGWLDESDGRRWYTVWGPDSAAAAVAIGRLRRRRGRARPVRRGLGHSTLISLRLSGDGAL